MWFMCSVRDVLKDGRVFSRGVCKRDVWRTKYLIMLKTGMYCCSSWYLQKWLSLQGCQSYCAPNKNRPKHYIFAQAHEFHMREYYSDDLRSAVEQVEDADTGTDSRHEIAIERRQNTKRHCLSHNPMLIQTITLLPPLSCSQFSSFSLLYKRTIVRV